MIKITNGHNTLIVTNGAFKSHYSHNGYIEVPKGEDEENKVDVVEEDVDDDDEDEDVDDEETEDDEEEEGSDDDKEWSEAQMTIPIGNWKKEDLKRFVTYNKIDVGDAEKVEPVKKIVKEWIKDNTK